MPVPFRLSDIGCLSALATAASVHRSQELLLVHAAIVPRCGDPWPPRRAGRGYGPARRVRAEPAPPTTRDVLARRAGAFLASPARARSLFTVRAAISSAASSERPRSFRPSLMCSYCRSRLALHALCGIGPSSLRLPEPFPERGANKRRRHLTPLRVAPIRFAPANPIRGVRITVIRTRTAGLVGAMIPSRLCGMPVATGASCAGARART